MKGVFSLFCALLFTLTVFSQEYSDSFFVVNIHMEGDSNLYGIAKLNYVVKNGVRNETQNIRGNILKFSGLIDEYTIATLSITKTTMRDLKSKSRTDALVYAKENMSTIKLPVFLIPGKQNIIIAKDFKSVTIQPETVVQKELRNLIMKNSSDFDEHNVKFKQLLDSKNSNQIFSDKAYKESVLGLRKKENKRYEEFIRNNIGEEETAYAFSKIASSVIINNPLLADSLFYMLPLSFQNSEKGKKLLEQITTANIFSIGKQAKNFTQTDLNGKLVSLSDYKGKYILVDFWASWCKPCREENPNIVTLYRKYKKENFEILGVSLDSDKKKWVEAVKKDGLAWTQVSDLQGWGNEVAKMYFIKSIPQSVLIDPAGKIIARNLRGKELSEKLGSLF